MRVGVLAAQGAFQEHIAALCQLDADAVPIRLPRELDHLGALVIPGGESTSISRVMLDFDLTTAIRKRAAAGMPIWGTCAGMILLAKTISDGEKVEPLRLMDITVRRNAFGRQVDSFEADLDVPALDDGPFHAVFIRAPLVESVGDDVEVLARLPDETIVAVKQGALLGTSFHPELTDDLRFHRYFLELARGQQREPCRK